MSRLKDTLHRDTDPLGHLKSEIDPTTHRINPPKRLTAEPEYLRAVIGDEVSIVAAYADNEGEEDEQVTQIPGGKEMANNACDRLVQKLNVFFENFENELENIPELRENLQEFRLAVEKRQFKRVLVLAKICLKLAVDFNFLRAIQHTIEREVLPLSIAKSITDRDGFVQERCNETRQAIAVCASKFAPEIDCIQGLRDFLNNLLRFAAVQNGSELYGYYLDNRLRFFNT